MANITLKGTHGYLRALEPQDLDFLYELENNSAIWEISNTLKPYSKAVLKDYLAQAHRDIYEVKQLRLCVCNAQHTVIGLIDLFDFDPKHKRAGVGLVILNPADRNKGMGAEALSLLWEYATTVLELHQLYANILEDNSPSIHLFEKMGFTQAGIKRDWVRWGGQFKNELIYQKIKA